LFGSLRSENPIEGKKLTGSSFQKFDTLEQAQEKAEKMIAEERNKVGGITLIGDGDGKGKYDVRLFDKMEQSKDKTWVQRMQDSKDDKTWLIQMEEGNQVNGHVR
jgi:hypothetical protein